MIPEIGLWEFLLLALVALIIINPDDWPKVLRKVGYYYGQIHDFMLETRQFSRRTYHDIVGEEESAPGMAVLDTADNSGDAVTIEPSDDDGAKAGLGVGEEEKG